MADKTIVTLETTAEGLEKLRALVLARDPGFAAVLRENKCLQFDDLKIGPDGFLIE
jgi:hypothetical protein